ncbi:protein quiver [Caerostris darwini]|uniref:Protein quiver n=1 Tax=Caerostris darwini TaxID=1538125 RepID=A0AAV4S5M8_9ARAC|nr:protein quiver [Caerostris darwini]
MKAEVIIVTCVLCVLYFFGSAEGIKCWVCRSDADPRCVDPFDNTTLPITDCDVMRLPQYPELKATMCRKMRQKVYGNWRYIRTCAFLGSPGEGTGNENHCTMKTGTYNVYSEVCTCNSKDGCNSASSINLSYLAILLTALLVFKIRFYR